ncbi:sensor histidine kinase [Streptomyces iranensis]|uniref:histidine kinase n=1 Tax=Streptomyces iranensis TaxID=576784 RepID=A0A060ZJC7_9ACTN|nr:Signal transduction histidine kinase-likeprotein [Streptomyces iranensis]
MRQAALPNDRAVRAAGGVSALIVVVLAGWVAGLLRVNDEWLALAYPHPRGATVLTRVAVGVPVLGVGVLLLAERSARRYGGVLLVAGGLWLLPSAAAGLLGLADLGTTGAVLSLLLAAAKMACRPLTVLLLPLWLFPRGGRRRWQWWVISLGASGYWLGYAGLWLISEPRVGSVANPAFSTASGQWAFDHLDAYAEAEPWVLRSVAAAVTAALCCRAAVSRGAERRDWALLAAAYPACVSLLLSQWGEGVPTIVARTVGSAVWAAAICLGVARTGIWRLDRSTSHRLARAFVLTSLAAVVVCAVVAVQAGLPSVRSGATTITAGCALVLGWGLRPSARKLTLCVERAFYGPRARPHEAVSALAVRLQQAPHPGEVPQQICRSAVEDLGVSGAAVSVDTRAGPRRLASVGAPLTGAVQTFLLRHHGRTVGRLEVSRDGSGTPAERDSGLLSLLADQAAPALAALRLAEEAQAARERLVLAREQERRRLRREIHDGLGPQLAAVRLRLDIAQTSCPPGHPATPQLCEAAETLAEALVEVRRITAGLAPAALAERGLAGAVRDLAHRLGVDGLRVTVANRPAALPPLSPGVETAAYRIAAESLTNAVRHARARQVSVELTAGPDTLEVKVTDDGSGLRETAVPGVGLASVTERAEEIGGSCSVTGSATGTVVHAVLPLAGPGEHGNPEEHRKPTGHEACRALLKTSRPMSRAP